MNRVQNAPKKGTTRILCCLFLFALPVSGSALHVNRAHAVSGNSDQGEETDRPVLRGDEKGVETSSDTEATAKRSRTGRRKRVRSRSESRTRPRRRVFKITEGPYSGVVPGTNNPPPGKQQRDATRCVLLWPGFHMGSNGQGTVFLQFNKRAEMQQSSGKLRLDLLFPGCRIPLKNNRRRLVTRYFPTIVDSLHAKNTRKGLHVTIQLKREGTANHKWVTENEHEFLYLLFNENTGSVDTDR